MRRCVVVGRAERVARSGIDKSRIVLSALFSLEEHLLVKGYCNLFLDTPLFNAHGTATDALWAGATDY